MGDAPTEAGPEIARRRLAAKGALRAWYQEGYRRYAEVLARCPRKGVAVELGSGGGFLQEILPDVYPTDVVAAQGLAARLDASHLPFASGSLRALFLTNVFHHLSDPPSFLREAQRCLVPGGRMLMIDQHRGPISEPILRYAHREPYDPSATQWSVATEGPMAGANGALAWIVFVRDRARFQQTFPELDVVRYVPHTPLRYWLSGGLERWSLLPAWAFGVATAFDNLLASRWPDLGSFVDIELVRRPA